MLKGSSFHLSASRKSRISDASRIIAGMMREFVSSGYDRFAWAVDYKAALRNAAAWVDAYVERFCLCVPTYGNDGSYGLTFTRLTANRYLKSSMMTGDITSCTGKEKTNVRANHHLQAHHRALGCSRHFSLVS